MLDDAKKVLKQARGEEPMEDDNIHIGDVIHQQSPQSPNKMAIALIATLLLGPVAGSLATLALSKMLEHKTNTTEVREPKEFRVKWWIEDDKVKNEIK